MTPGTRAKGFERPHGREGDATVLLTIEEGGTFERLLEFPGGGDTSCPGFSVFEDHLRVSYSSSHEGKTQIYLSRIPLGELTE